MQYRIPGALLFAVLAFPGIAHAGGGDPAQGAEPPSIADPHENDAWLDRMQRRVHETVSGSAKRIDGLFGVQDNLAVYDRASGSVAPALLWDEFDGFQPRLRFRVSVPLPQLDERVDAFIGRVNPEEYVTEREQDSGAFRRQYGPVEEDETLLGIRFHDERREGGSLDAGAGVRLQFPLDPYVKGSYLYERGTPSRLLFAIKETAFWRDSEGFGLTSRVDLSRVFEDRWLVRWTGSATFSQKSEGVRGYTTFTVLRGFPNRRAAALELFMTGELDAPVPLGEYGAKVAYRQAIVRDWLVMEIRTSVTWPKDLPEQSRKPSWGVGMGFEMLFGSEQFRARPMTF